MRQITLTLTLALLACGPDGAPGAQRLLLTEHIPRVKEIVRQDRERVRSGVLEAASRLAPGMRVEEAESRENQMRRALRLVQEPPRGISEFIASPISFLAVIDSNGVVLCRDGSAENDRMKGQDFGERFEVVRRALAGEAGYELGEFGDPAEGDSSFSMLFAAPMRSREGAVIGATLAGIPLWREAQRISRQLRVELAPEIEQGMVVWVSLYNGDRTFTSPDAPRELVGEHPDAATRREGLQRSPGGFTAENMFFRKWYGYAVIPLPTIGEGVGLIAYRSEPDEP